MQEQLYKLRSETKDEFDKAKALEARWKEIEKEQNDVYQVLQLSFLSMIWRLNVSYSVFLRNSCSCDYGMRQQIKMMLQKRVQPNLYNLLHLLGQLKQMGKMWMISSGSSES